MLKTIFTYIVPFLSAFFVLSQNCPDDINNSPGNSNNTVDANVYDASGNLIQTITCDATGNSGKLDCNLGNYNFPTDVIISVELSNGPNTTTCYYDGTGERIDNVSLPVDFGGMTVENIDDVNVIEWETNSESNNSFFKLEYSSNGVDWSEIQKMDGSGDSYSKSKYSAIHENFRSGINYYQLTQYDYDGESQILATESIENNVDLDFMVKGNKIIIYSKNKIKTVQCIALDGKRINYEIIANNENQIGLQLQNYNNGFVFMNVLFVNGDAKQKKIYLNR